MFIQNNDQLKQFYQECQKDKIIAIDTEFHWTDTYRPIPCLIQIANKQRVVLFDLIKYDLDLDPLKALFGNLKVLKIFHSARQDLEIFYNLFNEIPSPFFDTQIGIKAINSEDSISLENIYRKLLNINLSKLKGNIDWRKRPLTERQINYATNDVKYLIKTYEIIIFELKKLKRVKWVLEQKEKLLNKKIFENKSKLAWEKIKFKPKYKNELFILKKISEYREIEAKKSNLTNNRILANSDLIKLSKKITKKKEKNMMINKIESENLKKKITNLLSKKMLFKIKFSENKINEQKKIKIKMAREILNGVCKELNIHPSLVANKKDLEDIFLGKKTEILKGWRLKVFGKKILKII